MYIFSYEIFVKLTLKTYVAYTIVITQSWFRRRTLKKISNILDTYKYH